MRGKIRAPVRGDIEGCKLRAVSPVKLKRRSATDGTEQMLLRPGPCERQNSGGVNCFFVYRPDSLVSHILPRGQGPMDSPRVDLSNLG